MEFAIQVGNPRYFKHVEEDSTELNEILQDLFPFPTEFCFLIWNHVYIPLDYKYDISIILDDIVHLFREILENESGELYIAWPSNTFRTEWTMAWDAVDITITTAWWCVIGHCLEDVLNKVNVLKINKVDFLREWKMLLMKIVEVVSGCERDVPEIHEIKELLERVEGKGVLYTKDTAD
jgi:hypothetical protein